MTNNTNKTEAVVAPCVRTRIWRVGSFGSAALTLCAALAVPALGLTSAQVGAAEEIAYQKPASDSALSAPKAVSAPSTAPIELEAGPALDASPAAGARPAIKASPAAVASPAIDASPAIGAYPAAGAQLALEPRLHRADFGRELASHEARRIADWIVDSADNKRLPFVILDKIAAKMFVFDAAGRLVDAAAALLGSARGDDSVPGIGDREFSDMPPATRTTPAGRFVAALGTDTHGKDIVWVDYEAAVGIHRVINTKPKERRLQRLATPTPLDNRISYGCINVPVRFYEKVVKPAFTGTDGIVYVLPETRPALEVFNAYDVGAPSRITVR